MTLRDTNVIDTIRQVPDSGTLVLSLFDDTDWQHAPEHWDLLCEKLDRYLAFLVSGQVFEHWQGDDVDAFVIDVAFLHEPPAHIAAALERSQSFVAGLGFTMLWRLRQA